MWYHWKKNDCIIIPNLFVVIEILFLDKWHFGKGLLVCIILFIGKIFMLFLGRLEWTEKNSKNRKGFIWDQINLTSFYFTNKWYKRTLQQINNF